MGERTCKIWGERWLIRQDSTHANSILKIKAGFECSWHRHREKYNVFAVISGEIGIVVESTGIETILGVGETFVTTPGQWHKFVCYKDAVVVEEMYVNYDESDIERQTTGGPVK